MPFLDVLAPDPLLEDVESLAGILTASLAEVWSIPRDIITVYFTACPARHYAHAGRVATGLEEGRIFIKLHAFRRDVTARRSAAEALTAACASHGLRPSNVIVYFMDRAPDEVAHGGVLESDRN